MTSRQFYFALIIFTITLKIQKLPCLIFEQLNKDGVFLIFLFLIVDVLGIIIVYLLAKNMKKNEINRFQKPSFLTFLIKLCLISIAFYFIMQSLLFYEAIQDLFSHVLFDDLSWTIFSFFLLFAVFYLATMGLKIIGRSFELNFALVIVSLVILGIFGMLHTNLTNIFPLETLRGKNFFEPFVTFNLWFGDFILVFFLTINSKDTKLKFTILSYVVSMIFVMALYVIYYGIFLDYSATQPSLVSIISEQALLGIDIGRLDWFCILTAEIGAVLCSALCLCFAKRSIKFAFPKLDSRIVLLLFTILIYIIDIFVLVDTHAKEVLFMQFADIYSLIIKILIFTLLLIVNLHFYFKNKKKRAKL